MTFRGRRVMFLGVQSLLLPMFARGELGIVVNPVAQRDAATIAADDNWPAATTDSSPIRRRQSGISMIDRPANPPYFDALFSHRALQDSRTAAAFRRHVHWGYWDEPPPAACSPEEYDRAAERLCQMICQEAGIRDGMRVVDVGCGFGGTLAHLNARFANLKLIGVNIDTRQLVQARRLVQPQRGNSIEFVRADAARIPLPEASCDVVLSVESVFHFNRPRFFAEASRLLKSDGNLTLSDFVPSERALEFFDGINLSASDDIHRTYGQVDLGYSTQRYRELARTRNLQLGAALDVTENTLPTYEFLYGCTRGWSSAEEVEQFTAATRLLEKATRSGMLQYLILQFEHHLD